MEITTYTVTTQAGKTVSFINSSTIPTAFNFLVCINDAIIDSEGKSHVGKIGRVYINEKTTITNLLGEKVAHIAYGIEDWKISPQTILIIAAELLTGPLVNSF